MHVHLSLQHQRCSNKTLRLPCMFIMSCHVKLCILVCLSLCLLAGLDCVREKEGKRAKKIKRPLIMQLMSALPTSLETHHIDLTASVQAYLMPHRWVMVLLGLSSFTTSLCCWLHHPHCLASLLQTRLTLFLCLHPHHITLSERLIYNNH